MKDHHQTQHPAIAEDISKMMIALPADEYYSATDDHWIQRPLDLVVAAALLVLALPIIVMRLGINRLNKRAAVTSRQVLGRSGAPFLLLSTKTGNDYDPLIQLFNVLVGDMSLVGPRPLCNNEAMLVPDQYRLRFTVRPGVFSPYQLKKITGIDFESEWHTDCEEIKQKSATKRFGMLARFLLTGIFGMNADSVKQDNLTLFGVDITNSTMDEALDWMLDRAQAEKPTNVGIVNADTLNKAYRNEDYLSTLNKFDRVLADGIGVRIAGKIASIPLRGNLNGTDLFPRLCKRMADKGLSIFLLGARPDIANSAAANIKQRYPALHIAGTHHGYFSAGKEEMEVISKINNSNASVLLVAFGSPIQEQWIRNHAERLRPAVRIGVGGLFDFYSGRIPRAPIWIREMGMEWGWRLIQEPGRMWRRYIVGNPLFLLRVWHEQRWVRKWGIDNNAGQHRILEHTQRIYSYARLLILRARLRRWAWFAGIHAQQSIKRTFDILCVSSMLVILAPLLVLVGAAIKLDSPGPVLFSQIRIGKGGKPFRLWKFRSMHQNSETRLHKLESLNEMPNGVLFKMKNDPRTTPVGRFIRKYSIDELPQLWNVLMGDMSLVGPRPALPKEVSQYSLQDLKRLETVPGLTCYWQVSGRSMLSFQKQVELDTQYLYSRSFSEDLKILLRTVPAVLRGDGAY